jgi:hypothetical protein
MAVRKATKEDLLKCMGGDYEPHVTHYLHATVVIEDGRGGLCRFDISEMADLSKQVSGLVHNDAPPVVFVDLSQAGDE